MLDLYSSDPFDENLFSADEAVISEAEMEQLLFAGADAAIEQGGSGEGPDQFLPFLAPLIGKVAPMLVGALPGLFRKLFRREAEMEGDHFIGGLIRRIVPGIAKTVFGGLLRRGRRGRRSGRLTTGRIWSYFNMLLRKVLSNPGLRRRYIMLTRRIMARFGRGRARRRPIRRRRYRRAY